MDYFLDTYALIEIAKGNLAYQKYQERSIVTLRYNLAELYYILLKDYDKKTADFFLDKFAKIAAELPFNVISSAMEFKLKNKNTNFSYIDCLGYAYSLEEKNFLTGDRAFSAMKNAEIVR